MKNVFIICKQEKFARNQKSIFYKDQSGVRKNNKVEKHKLNYYNKQVECLILFEWYLYTAGVQKGYKNNFLLATF